MKKIIVFLLFFSSLHVFSQAIIFPNDFNRKEIKNLKQLNLGFKNYSFDDVNFNKDLKELAYFNKKRKQNKVWAYVFSSAGTLLLASAIAIDIQEQKNSKNEIIHGFKTLTYFSSAIYLGASIPFFVGNIKNKKKMKKKLIFVEDKLNRLQ